MTTGTSNITHGQASKRGTSGVGPQLARSGGRYSLSGETTAQRTARYLAGKVPVIETGRLLSLEQVPTEGLRY
ncbi:hypothetical protein DJ564_22360 [Pseudomonas sp. 31-12]|nr:hypothetical protein DJ564_22360 [Pseudomonas sp. 31-12]